MVLLYNINSLLSHIILFPKPTAVNMFAVCNYSKIIVVCRKAERCNLKAIFTFIKLHSVGVSFSSNHGV